jgi:hypothetical protein
MTMMPASAGIEEWRHEPAPMTMMPASAGIEEWRQEPRQARDGRSTGVAP